jgi:hypothetical protein
MSPTPTNPTTSARNRLAALLAHHADVAAAALRADARTGLPEYRSGMDRAVELLDLHAAHLTADKETPAVRELLDSILAFEAERPDLAHARQVLGTTTGQPESEGTAVDREGAELVCVDQCGCCDACGMEPYGTPAEGWRDAARFLRRTSRESPDFLGAIRGARLIEDELRRLADEAQQPTPAVAEEPK